MKNFDFICYRIKDWDPLKDKIHVHDDSYEILQITGGSGNFVIGGTPYPIISGAVYFINAVQLHCSRPVENQPYIRSKATVRATYLNEVMRVIGCGELAHDMFEVDGGCCVSLPQNAIGEVDGYFRKMAELMEQNDENANAKITILMLNIILACASYRSTLSVSKPSENTLISRTVSYINTNISADLSIETIAKEIFVSKYHLCRTFKKEFGVSIMKYILSQRLTLAKEQLIHTEMSCSDIAMMIGFSSFSYFCRAFKQQEGITPNQYRHIYGNCKKGNKEQ